MERRRVNLVRCSDNGYECSSCTKWFRTIRDGKIHVASCTRGNGESERSTSSQTGSIPSSDDDCSSSGSERWWRRMGSDMDDLDDGGNGREGDLNAGEPDDEPPWLEELHELMEEYDTAAVVDGDRMWFDFEALGGDYFPWRNITELLVAVWAIVTRPSRRSLQMLLDFLRFEDSTGRGFDRAEVPPSAEHLVSRMRHRLPLLPVLKRNIKDRAGNVTEAMGVPLGTLLQRILDCPRLVEEYVANFAGHRLSTEERQQNRIPDEHLTPIPNRHVDGARRSFMNGELMHSTAHMGIECISVGGGEDVRVTVGDTVMAKIPTSPAEPIPCRIAALFWEEPRVGDHQGLQLARGQSDFWRRCQPSPQVDDSEGEHEEQCSTSSSGSDPEREERRDSSSMSTGESAGDGKGDSGSSATGDANEDEGAGTGHLVVRLNRFIFRDEMHKVRAVKRPRHERGTEVWELVNDPVEVGVEALEGPCVVTARGASGEADGDAVGEPAADFVAAGFVSKTPRAGTLEVEKIQWRRSGFDGLFLDRRAIPVYDNVHRYPVFSTGIVVASDAFNYFSLGGSNYSVNSSYFALGCINPTLLRRLRSWFMCSVGAPRARWEEDVGPLMATIKMLQNGCRARVSTGDGNTITALVRMGLLTANLDSPMHSKWSGTKCSGGKTHKPCSTCNCTRRDLANEDYPVKQRRRTDDQLEDDLAYVLGGSTRSEKKRRSQKRGVTIPAVPNPLRELVFSRVRGIGVDIMHQDAINKTKHIIRFAMDACNESGVLVLAGRLAARAFLPPNASPIPDITSDGGWAALTGQQLWLLSSIIPLVFRPMFADADAMDRYVKDAAGRKVARRMRVSYDTAGNKAKVGQSFQALLIACSTSSFMVRAPEFTDEGLRVLEKATRNVVKQVKDTMGVGRGTYHKGMHIADNIRDLGVPTNTNAGESKHKEAKKHAGSASGRDNLAHIMRTNNDAQAMKALVDGVQWKAQGWNKQEWVWETVEAGEGCREALDAIFKFIPMAPGCEEHDGKVGKPHGFLKWKAKLQEEGRGGTNPVPTPWQKAVFATMPNTEELQEIYDERLGCGRESGDARCARPTCSYCWRGSSYGLSHRDVTCFNHWVGASAEASAGTGVIRGGAVEAAHVSPREWALSRSTRGSDVELYMTDDARKAGARGVGRTTLGKVAYFFEHKGNDFGGLEDDEIEDGLWTTWVAVLEYVTAGRGHSRRTDTATGCDEFKLRQTFSFFPASFIRRVVHVVHECHTKGANSCRLVGQESKRAEWRCCIKPGDTYLVNKYFHALGRDPIIT